MRMMKIIAILIALTVTKLGYAETTVPSVPVAVEAKQPTLVDQLVTETRGRLGDIVQQIAEPLITFKVTKRDVECLARNIFYEAGSEPEEGKVAVGMVTINRVKDGRFAGSICSVVNQRTMVVREYEVKTAKVSNQRTRMVTHIPVCQFSWACGATKKPRSSDDRWEESQQVAEALVAGEYPEYQDKYSDALYFHATSVRPGWAKQKSRVNKIGGHIFYSDRI